MTPELFAAHILTLCRRHHASVTSWIRSPNRNTLVGGRPNSYHLTGCAVDLILDENANHAHFLADAQMLDLEVIDEGDHLHIEPAGPP